MFEVETLSARISTERTPLAGAPTATRSDQAWVPSSPMVSATPPPLGRRRPTGVLSKFHFLPRCRSSTTSLPFFKPISLRFCPSSPVRLRLSSQSRPASMLLDGAFLSGLAGAATGGGTAAAGDDGDGGTATGADCACAPPS